jgi:hypothetical protein
MTLLRALLLGSIVGVALAQPLAAQLVRGTVTDSATRSPIRAAVVTLEEQSRPIATARTDSIGAFSFVLPGAGPYRVRIRYLGYEPAITPAFTIPAGQERVLRFPMRRAVYALDPVVRTDDRTALFKVTSGETWFKKHESEGKGLFLTGLEILKSRRSACDFFANLPGLRFGVWTGVTGESGGVAIARGAIPCWDKRLVMPDRPDPCIAAMVDRWGYVIIIDSLDLHVRPRPMPGPLSPRGTPTTSSTIRDSVIVPLENVFGIEIYAGHEQLPRDAAIPMEVAAGNTRCMWIQIWTHIAW